jgi:hypothetical protein
MSAVLMKILLERDTFVKKFGQEGKNDPVNSQNQIILK